MSEFDEKTNTIAFESPQQAIDELGAANAKLQAEAERRAHNYISVDCLVESARTDWDKKELKVTLSAKREDTEYEAERLGEVCRLESPVRISIYQQNEDIERAVSVNAIIDGVKLDWKTEKLSINITMEKLVDEMIEKALRLGVMAHMEFPCTARFEAAQRRLF
jgi:hypothetical protein